MNINMNMNGSRPTGPVFRKAGKTVIKIVAVLIVAAIVASFCAVKIPTGFTGVVTNFGKVTGRTLDPGLHFKAPWQNVVKMDTRIQVKTVDLSCFSSDIQEVIVNYALNFQIASRDTKTIYSIIGPDYYNVVIVPNVAECVKTVCAKYNAEDLIGERAALANTIEDMLSDKLANYNITVISTSITDIDFKDSFTDAVEAKQVAQQNKLRAETEAQQKIVEAEAAQQVRKINADAEAYEVKIKAEAEAEANKKISESLNEQILQKMYYDNWDGKLPTVMGGDGAMSLIEIPATD
ncbi:MAG: prohibitin family protein [Firmicutes bacterium]|nr:prohibitin family protein [Bacillota bacterium]